MRSLRRKIRQAVLAALPMAVVGCADARKGPTSGASSAAAGLSSGASGISAAGGTTGARSASSGGTTGSENLCQQCIAQGMECDFYATACVPICTVCPCDYVPALVEVFDGGYPDGGLPVPLCEAVCPNPYGRDAGGWTVWSCGVLDGGCPPPAAGMACVVCTAENCIGGGRAPGGVRWRAPSGGDGVGGYLAAMAQLEAASVVAFGRLGAELRALGAPRRLWAEVDRAQRDEIRHARLMTGEARRFGAAPSGFEMPEPGPRSLAEMAEENLREGCIRETLGAAVLAWQGMHAREPRLRKAFASMARDEARHAELAWRVHAWAVPRLESTEAQRLRQVREEAVAELACVGVGVHRAPWNDLVGLPTARAASALTAELRRTLWSETAPAPPAISQGEIG